MTDLGTKFGGFSSDVVIEAPVKPVVTHFDLSFHLRVFSQDNMELAREEAINQLIKRMKMTEPQARSAIEDGLSISLNATGLWKND